MRTIQSGGTGRGWRANGTVRGVRDEAAAGGIGASGTIQPLAGSGIRPVPLSTGPAHGGVPDGVVSMEAPWLGDPVGGRWAIEPVAVDKRQGRWCTRFRRSTGGKLPVEVPLIRRVGDSARGIAGPAVPAARKGRQLVSKTAVEARPDGSRRQASTSADSRVSECVEHGREVRVISRWKVAARGAPRMRVSCLRMTLPNRAGRGGRGLGIRRGNRDLEPESRSGVVRGGCGREIPPGRSRRMNEARDGDRC